MPDIRQTPLLDDFQRADENPLSFGGKWSGVNGSGLRLLSNAAQDPGSSGGGLLSVRQSYWNVTSWSGDVEVWAYPCGLVSPFQQGWLLGLASSISPFSGYTMRWSDEVGNSAIQTRKWNAGSNTVLQDYRGVGNALPNDTPDNVLLMRTSGSAVELWWSQDFGASWTKVTSVTDNTYRTGLYGVIGLNGSPDWCGFGAGQPVPGFPQIYRWIKAQKGTPP